MIRGQAKGDMMLPRSNRQIPDLVGPGRDVTFTCGEKTYTVTVEATMGVNEKLPIHRIGAAIEGDVKASLVENPRGSGYLLEVCGEHVRVPEMYARWIPDQPFGVMAAEWIAAALTERNPRLAYAVTQAPPTANDYPF